MASIRCHRHLPDELITEILIRLPVKSQLRFRSTCKRWDTLITSQSFMNDHFHHESNNTRLLICLYRFVLPGNTDELGQQQFSSSHDETLELHDLDQLKLNWRIRTVCGPCNGVFCVRPLDDKLALWNPATRRLRLLPFPSQMPDESYDYGFGVDPFTHEFKIVLIRAAIFRSSQPCFAIYNTSSFNSWRYFKNEQLPHLGSRVLKKHSGATFMNGFCYWILYSNWTSEFVILAFHMHKNVFQEIKAYRNMVMMEPGRWTKLYNMVTHMRPHEHLGFWKRKMVILVSNNETMEVILYDPHSRTKETLVAKRDGRLPKYLRSFNYNRSLTPV